MLTNLHPSYLVDQLHDKVSSDVQDQNKIKKQQAKQVITGISVGVFFDFWFLPIALSKYNLGCT